jgi:hypothetical protein
MGAVQNEARFSTGAEAVRIPKRPGRPRPRLRTARFEDYEQLMRLESTLSPETLSFDDWRTIWLGSPVWPSVSSWWPIGWVLELPDGELVGCLGNVPLRYHFRGEPLMAASGRAWVVLPQHRAYGSARKLLDAHFGQSADVVLDTSVSQEGSDRAGYLSNRIPAGDWESIAYFVTGYRAFAARALHKLKVPLAQKLAPVAGAGLRLKDLTLGKHLPGVPSGFSIEEPARFDSRFDAFWNELLRQKTGTMLAARDSATLTWHFAVPIRKKRLWIFTASRNQQLRAYSIFERKDSAGEDLRRMRLIDYQTIEPEADLFAGMLSAALRRCVAENISVLSKSGLGLAATKVFDETAPYRGKQPWPFWYRSENPALAEELSHARHWEPTEYDGDASIG